MDITRKEERQEEWKEIQNLIKELIKVPELAPSFVPSLTDTIHKAFRYIDKLEKENNDMWHRTHPESMGK
jgi:predicted methyltransferase